MTVITGSEYEISISQRVFMIHDYLAGLKFAQLAMLIYWAKNDCTEVSSLSKGTVLAAYQTLQFHDIP